MTILQFYTRVAFNALTVTSKPFRSSLRWLHLIEDTDKQSSQVQGIVVLAGKLYVTRREADLIEMYFASTPYHFVGVILLPDLYVFTDLLDPALVTLPQSTNQPNTSSIYATDAVEMQRIRVPWCLAACLYMNAIYAGRGRGIWKIVDDESSKVWLRLEQDILRSITVTTGGMLIILVKRHDDEHLGTVHMCNYDGEYITTVALPDYIRNPENVLLTDKDTLLVCHSSRKHKLSLISQFSFFGEFLTCSKNIELDRPLHFVSVGDDILVVVDCGNERLVMIDTNLKQRRVLLEHAAMTRVFYDATTGQLYVGLVSGDIELYQLVSM